ncbi:MAG: PKD domain-containing protein [Pseudomonadota bacterium]
MSISSRYIYVVVLLALWIGVVPVSIGAGKQLTPQQQAALLFILRSAAESGGEEESGAEEKSGVEDADIDITLVTGNTLWFDTSNAVSPSGDPWLRFDWTVTSQPAGSQVEFVDVDTATPSITFILPGVYALTVTAFDAEGNQAVDVFWVKVTNPPPVPIITPIETEPVVGLPFTFDGSSSYHPDDLRFTYQWSLLEQPLNSGLEPQLGTGPQVEVVFDQPGTYALRLTVSDGVESSSFDLEPFEVILYNTFPLAIGFDDAEFDPINERIVTLLDRDLSLITADGQQSVIQLPLDGKAVSVSPDGTFAAVGHDGWVSHVNLNTRDVLNTYPVAADIPDVVLDEKGIAHVIPDRWQFNTTSVDMSTGQIITGTGWIRGNSRAKLHASGNRIYTADNGVSPSDLERFDIDPVDGSLNSAYDSPYHGDYPFCGDLWMHPAGDLALSRCRVVVRTTGFQESDLTFAMQLPEGVSPQIHHASVNGFNDEWLIIDRPFSWIDSGSDSVRTVDAVNGVARARYYTPYQQGVDSSRWTAVFVFGQSDSARHFVLAVDDPESPQTYALLVSQAPPTDGANLAPTARVQRYTSVREETPVQLDATGSSDPEGEPLSYLWRVVQQPDLSALDLSNLNGATAAFTPDAPGAYEFELQVNDGVRNSPVVRATVNAFAPGADLVHRLEGNLSDVEYSKSLNALILIDELTLRMISLSDLSEQQLELPLPGYRVGLSPDGEFAAVSHAASASLISLTNLSVLDRQDNTEDWGDIVLDHNNVAHLVPNRDQWSYLISLNFATDEVSSLRSARAGTRIRMHPIENWVYGADTGSSPSDFEKWDVSTYPPTYLGDSPYHGDFDISGNIWISEDGDRAAVAGGNTFNLSSDANLDMTYSGGVDDGLRVQWADHSTEIDTWAMVPSQNADAEFAGKLLMYSDRFFNLIESRPLASIPTVSGGASADGTHVFFADDGSRVIVVLQGEGIIDRHAVQLIDLGQ